MSQSGRFTPSIVPGTYIQTLTGNTGGAVSPTVGGNINVLGSGPIAVTGNPGTNTLTISSSGITLTGDSGGPQGPSNSFVLSGGFTGLTFNGSGNNLSLEGDLAVTSGGTGQTTLTNHGVLVGAGTSAITQLAVGTTGQVLTGVTGSDPIWQTPVSSSISITGNTGGALVGNAFTFSGGTTGLSFNGSGSTETLTFAGITANNGTVSLATDATTSTVNVGTGAGNKTTTIGSSSSGSSTVVQSGSSGLLLESASGFISLDIAAASGAGPITIGGDTNSYQINVGATGAKTLNIGSGTAGSQTTITGGSDGTYSGLYLRSRTGNSITIGTAAIDSTPTLLVLGSPNTTSSTTIQAGSGGVILSGYTGVVTANGSSAITTSTLTQYNVLVGSTSNTITSVSPSTSGFVLTSNGPSANPSFQAIPSSSITWSVITANQTAVVKSGYFCNKAGTLALALPATSAVGDVIEVSNENTALGIQITQASGQQILYGNTNTTSGATGSLTSSAVGDTLKLVCKTANTIWRVTSSIGNWSPV